jgi:hypothetical protein
MTQIIEKNNHTIPEKFLETSLLLKPNYIFGEQKLDSEIQKFSNTTHVDNQEITPKRELSFFSAVEASLCSHIIKAIQKNQQTLFVPLPEYAQDNTLAQRIAHYITLPNTKSVVINADGLGAQHIISEYIKQLSLENTNNMYHEFAHLMTDYFRHGLVLHSVIYNAQSLSKQDFDYLYELASLIYEKFPKQRHKSLMRFVFIGDKKIAPILRKKTNGKLHQFYAESLTITECVNALYLYTAPEARTELFYQTVGTNAAGLLIACVGYPALLRRLLPMPDAPSLADKKIPEKYLSAYINSKINTIFHKEIANKRLHLKQGSYVNRSLTYIFLVLIAITIGLFFNNL